MRTLPVWLFSTGPIGDPLKPETPCADIAPMVELSGARAHHLFGGRIDRHDLGLAERAMVSMVGAADGDYRPWNEIEAWAEEIAATLNAEARVLQPA